MENLEPAISTVSRRGRPGSGRLGGRERRQHPGAAEAAEVAEGTVEEERPLRVLWNEAQQQRRGQRRSASSSTQQRQQGRGGGYGGGRVWHAERLS